MKTSKQQKVILLKLGGKCNLKCPRCHCLDIDFTLNEDIFDYIKKNDVKRITFSGGEPLLYYDLIKKVMETCGEGYAYKLVTNATLLNDEMIEFFNQYNTYVFASYDGENGERAACDPKYFKLGKIKNHGLAVTVYNKNLDLHNLGKDIEKLKEKNGLYQPNPRAFFPNFVHQTELSPNGDIDINTAKSYVLQVGQNLEVDFIAYKNGVPLSQLGFLGGIIFRWLSKKGNRGIKCCHEYMENLTIAGDFLLCPYGDTKVGDIYNGIDYDLVESYLPARCRECELWEICRNPCIANITQHECYIFKKLYAHFQKLLIKYDVTKAELCEKFNIM